MAEDDRQDIATEPEGVEPEGAEPEGEESPYKFTQGQVDTYTKIARQEGEAKVARKLEASQRELEELRASLEEERQAQEQAALDSPVEDWESEFREQKHAVADLRSQLKAIESAREKERATREYNEQARMREHFTALSKKYKDVDAKEVEEFLVRTALPEKEFEGIFEYFASKKKASEPDPEAFNSQTGKNTRGKKKSAALTEEEFAQLAIDDPDAAEKYYQASLKEAREQESERG